MLEGATFKKGRSGGVVLCADTESLSHPECLGLDDEVLSSQLWLHTVSDALQARALVRGGGRGQEIWVVGSDQMDAVNLAAALKRDRWDSTVSLVAFNGSGSLRSRAKSAGLDEVLDRTAFLARYGARKNEAVSRVSMISDDAPECVHVSASLDSVDTCSTASFTQVQLKADEAGVQVENGYLLAVVGAGGGVGKSTVSVLAAYIAQSMGYRTVLVDGDLQFGDMHYLTGCDDALRIDDLLASPSRVEVLEPQSGMPAVLAASARLERSEVVAHEFARVISLLRKRFDVVVVNTGPKWEDQHISLLESCSNALFVIAQRPSSIRACKHALELCARCGVASQPFLFALNRCARGSLFSAIDVSCALGGVRVAELADGGGDVEELLGAGQPLDLISSRNPLYTSIKTLLQTILPKVDHVPEAIFEGAQKESKRHRRFANRRKKAACL